MAVFAAMTAPISQATTSVDFAAPLATASVGTVLELRADSSTASTTTTSAVEALTTTFTPPVSCASELLTLLTAKSYQIWINEPAPVPGTLLTDCYPSEWVDHYTSVLSSSSSVVPMMSKLVCPSGWTTQSESTWSSGYMACCASGFTLAPPSSAVDSDRPAYGGTCYSNFALSQEATVTVYNATALSTTSEWTATTTPAQAYAHPIDGYALDYIAKSSDKSASSTETDSGTRTGTATSETSTSSSKSAGARTTSTNGGNLKIAGVALLVASAAMLF